MKYVLYIDYRASYKPMSCEYRPMDANTMAEAIVEADAVHNPETMYLIQIMEKNGNVEKLGGSIRVKTYTTVMEKRSTKWTAEGRNHSVKYFTGKFAEWFGTACK